MSVDTLSEIEERVCDVCAPQMGLSREEVRPSSRLIEDLSCDSLDMVELMMEIEQTFGVTLRADDHLRRAADASVSAASLLCSSRAGFCVRGRCVARRSSRRRQNTIRVLAAPDLIPSERSILKQALELESPE